MKALLVIVVVLLAMRLVGALALRLVAHGRRRPPATAVRSSIRPSAAIRRCGGVGPDRVRATGSATRSGAASTSATGLPDCRVLPVGSAVASSGRFSVRL
ncbi:hypothetical protein SAMN04489716_4382 [Actinoplanes derwentensis]|uniref:Uncharacterized protein n=1 Tax=Actinoplanes derwentensis TaxID=113562 RepID=A0A1H2B6Q6_9ACTN|nr:hypothetical protein SAMN04489716_4382 [Actinoplanes derwentensis]